MILQGKNVFMILFCFSLLFGAPFLFLGVGLIG